MATSQIVLDPCNPPGVPFSMDELAQELQKIPITKAVAWHCLPGICWKTQAISVAAFIYPKLQVWRGQNPIFVPPQWKVAHLTFVHKPAKTLDRLCHLRPLALLEPVGKKHPWINNGQSCHLCPTIALPMARAGLHAKEVTIRRHPTCGAALRQHPTPDHATAPECPSKS